MSKTKSERMKNTQKKVNKRKRIIKESWHLNDIPFKEGELRKSNLTCSCSMCKKPRYKRKGKVDKHE